MLSLQNYDPSRFTIWDSLWKQNDYTEDDSERIIIARAFVNAISVHGSLVSDAWTFWLTYIVILNILYVL